MDARRITRTRNIPPKKCNKQVTSKQQTRSFLTSINKSSKTTVVFGTAMTILEIGISFPTQRLQGQQRQQQGGSKSCIDIIQEQLL
jgi:hypothetical protein